MDLADKIALVTGGASGLGLSYVKELLRNGIKHVTIADLDTSKGEELVKTLNAEFGERRVIFVVCDVTKNEQFEEALAKTVKEFGGLDILINNAGVVNEPQWELVIDVNFTSLVRGTFLGLRYMSKDKGGKGGTIVNIASIFGLDPVAYAPVYTATKHAVIGFSRALSFPHQYEKTGVRILTMCPGITETPMLAYIPTHLSELEDPQEAIATIHAEYSTQKPEIVAEGMVHIIRSGKNGSIWVVEGEEPAHEVFIPDRFALKTPLKTQS